MLSEMLLTHDTKCIDRLKLIVKQGRALGGDPGARATALSPNTPPLSPQLKAFSYRSAKDPIAPRSLSLCARSLEKTILPDVC